MFVPFLRLAAAEMNFWGKRSLSQSINISQFPRCGKKKHAFGRSFRLSAGKNS
jgi:hypothetical protein